ncbi:sensor histidine kinase [Lederbergia citri]|uniref:histidine kinase n=1 Tax=Lederbergia citri TaxID=2833580 RepID=A0A942YH84_9BACI|nr:sensor histidine kinase [Lederbergia citri]MBS4196307.1 GHKL domain-containing protein [Lederbergia citri]
MVSHFFQYSFIYVYFAISFIFVCLFFISLPKRILPYLIYFSLFVAAIAINLLGVWHMPAAITYSSIIKYASYGASTFFFLFYEQIFGQGFKKINRRLWQLHLLCWILISVCSLFSIIRLEDTFLPYSVLNILSIIYIVIATIVKAFSGNKDARIINVGLICLAITIMIDILSAVRLVNYASLQTGSWGLLIFIGCVTTILLKRYVAKGSIFEPLTFHNDPIDLKLKADSMVMHILKNEISRLSYLNERSKRMLATVEIPIKDAIEKNFNEMDESLQHMNNMILAVKKTDDIELNPRKLFFNTVILETLSAFKSGHPTIDFSIDLSTTIELDIDPLHIRECITNVLSNSVEAIEHQNGKIHIHLYQKQHDAILDITDNGKGIHKHHLHDVITPLFTTKTSFSNYGVGLYYVYFVVKKHGGSLSIPYSEVGKGTTICIQLPVSTNSKTFWSVNAFGKNKSHAG